MKLTKLQTLNFWVHFIHFLQMVAATVFSFGILAALNFRWWLCAIYAVLFVLNWTYFFAFHWAGIQTAKEELEERNAKSN